MSDPHPESTTLQKRRALEAGFPRIDDDLATDQSFDSELSRALDMLAIADELATDVVETIAAARAIIERKAGIS